MNDDERWTAAACAARLAGQLQLGWLALLIGGVGLVALALQAPSPWWCGAVLVGLAERYVAVRLAVDVRLFDRLGGNQGDLQRLDAGLAALRMLPAGRAGRPLQQRVDGALGWARRHTLLVAAQVVIAALAVGVR